jgi:hypothetical protein
VGRRYAGAQAASQRMAERQQHEAAIAGPAPEPVSTISPAFQRATDRTCVAWRRVRHGIRQYSAAR